MLTTFDVSHLCHYRGCANPNHLVKEDHEDNQSQNICQGRFIDEFSGQGGRVNIRCMRIEIGNWEGTRKGGEGGNKDWKLGFVNNVE